MSILELEMVKYQEVHAVEVAQLIPLFTVLLFSFHAMSTATEQHRTACCAGRAWCYSLCPVDKTYFVYSWHIPVWQSTVNFRKTEAGGAHWRLPDTTDCFFKFKSLICLGKINFIFLRKLKRFQFQEHEMKVHQKEVIIKPCPNAYITV